MYVCECVFVGVWIAWEHCPVGWPCKIHRLQCRVNRPKECPFHDTKQSDGEVPLPSLLGPIWSGEVTSDWTLPLGQIELNCILMQN